ncbi:hypothetical protein OUZ56_031229 [Daphnia magna]|uniref:Uncharacterized protein n=1 Tax=Daphnia magna TaxID=35525 RepID=A0ABQ9ZTM8_9CRUS|nr:hypothetical protein OUZ56_031229 [Daphnia magna]
MRTARSCNQFLFQPFWTTQHILAKFCNSYELQSLPMEILCIVIISTFIHRKPALANIASRSTSALSSAPFGSRTATLVNSSTRPITVKGSQSYETSRIACQ